MSQSDEVLAYLLDHGMMPRELPPCFRVSGLAQFVQAHGPDPFGGAENKWTKPCRHNLARVGTLRRRLSTPNPISHYGVCRVIADYWDEICIKMSADALSKTSLILRDGTLRRAHSFDERPEQRAAIRAGKRVGLQLDIARFYSSIYTHAIGWATEGKAESKADFNANNLGNKLDKAIRNSQEGQTFGIPIGPQTSHVVAELMLAAVDKDAGFDGTTRGFRFSDDYEFAFSSRIELDTTLSDLQNALAEYELELNPAKTAIIDLPSALEDHWTTQLRRFAIMPSSQRSDLIAYFDLAISLTEESPTRPVLNYALGRISHMENLDDKNWPLVRSMISQFIIAEPGTAKFVFEIFGQRRDDLDGQDKNFIHEFLADMLRVHAPKGHGSEVVWALWGHLLFELPLDKDFIDPVVAMNDAHALLLIADCLAEDLSELTSAIANVISISSDELNGEMWLAAYELARTGKCGFSPDLITDHAGFKKLLEQDVSFYESGSSSNALWEEFGEYMEGMESEYGESDDDDEYFDSGELGI